MRDFIDKPEDWLERRWYLRALLGLKNLTIKKEEEMRKSVLALVLICCLPLASYAAGIGSPETQGKGKAGIGVDSDFVFGKDWKLKNATNLVAGETIKNIETENGYFAGARLIYGLLDNLDVYARIGASDYKVKDKHFTNGAESATDKFNTDTGIAYGIGLKGAYHINENLLLGCDLQYLRSKHEAKDNYSTAGGTELSTKYKSFTVQEWHVAPYVGYKTGNFLPYLGVRYSDGRLDMKKPSNTDFGAIKAEADNNFGVFLGTDYKIGENWKLNLEGRFVDEAAMSFGATYRF